MKKSIVLALGLVMSVFASAQAQNQTGIVKTRGRLKADGTVISGYRLSDAMVTVRGRNTVTSEKDGSFLIPLNTQEYYLESVRKQGYVLSDPDALLCKYVYSTTPLILVMDIPSQQMDDKLEAERSIRQTLRQQLQEKEDEIERLKEEKRISDEEYRTRLQVVFGEQEENEKLISEMAERYSKIDYDQLDEFNRQVNALILEGELVKADSLIQTKGSIYDRAKSLKRHQALNAKEEEALNRRKSMDSKELEDLAQDCYRKFEIFRMQYQTDSAIDCIKLRASLDTTNLDWQYDALSFLCLPWGGVEEALPYFDIIRRNASPTDKVLMDSYDWMGVLYHQNYSKALEYYTEALRIADFLGEDLERMVFSSKIAYFYSELGDYSKAVEYLLNTLPIIKDIYGSDHSLLADHHDRIGNIYKKMGDYSKALEYYKKALEMRKDAIFYEKAESYFNISLLYKEKGDLSKALKNGLTAVSIMDEGYPGWEKHMTYCDWVGNLYFRMGKMTDALAYYQKAIDLYEADNTPDESDMTEAELCYEVAGRCCDELEDYSKSVEYYMKAIPMLEELQGPDDLDLALLYNKVGHRQFRLSNYEEALENYGKAVNIFIKNYGQDHPDVATIYDNMGTVDLEAGSYVGAFLYFKKALDIRERLYGPDHPNLVGSYENLSTVYYVLDDSETGLKYYEKAEELKKKASAN